MLNNFLFSGIDSIICSKNSIFNFDFLNAGTIIGIISLSFILALIVAAIVVSNIKKSYGVNKYLTNIVSNDNYSFTTNKSTDTFIEKVKVSKDEYFKQAKDFENQKRLFNINNI